MHIPFVKSELKVSTVVLLGGGALLAFLLLGFGFLEITSQPLFCSSCHYMRPYYHQWKSSTHNKVTCLDCHAKPGITNYVRRKFEALHEVVSMATGKYPPRPHAEVDDATCLRPGCHETRLLKGKEEFKKGVVFDHTPHLTQERHGRKLRCTSCHAQMVMGNHIAVTEQVCFLCHFKAVASGADTLSSALCLKCHTLPQGTLTIRNTQATYTHADYVKGDVQCTDCHSGIVSGTGEVPQIMCMQCHNKPENLERIDDHEFIHENHVTNHKVECYLCHSEIRHTLASPPEPTHQAHARTECGQCHGAGHAAARMLYEGQGARGVADAPSSMALARVDCIGCHRERQGDPLGGMPTMRKATAAACVACHDSDAAGYLKDWRDQVAAATASATAALRRTEAIRGIDSIPEARQLLADARHNIAFVKAGDGIHNVEYAVGVLEKSAAMLAEAASLATAR